MKFAFGLQSKEISVEADIEGLIEKGVERKENPNRKSRYQIKQKERRKNKELKQKQLIQRMMYFVGIMVAFMILIVILGFIISKF